MTLTQVNFREMWGGTFISVLLESSDSNVGDVQDNKDYCIHSNQILVQEIFTAQILDLRDAAVLLQGSGNTLNGQQMWSAWYRMWDVSSTVCDES